jgi:hypothetical protein
LEEVIATNIVLDDVDGNQVTIQGFRLKVAAPDLLLDSPDRRHSPTSFRRALVHDFNDGLTVNYDGDYPGGITLLGVASITPKNTGEITSNLIINGGIQFEIETIQSGPSHVPIKRLVDLQEHLQEIVNN